MSTDPVFLFIKSETCGHCRNFSEGQWGDVQKLLAKNYPTLRVHTITFADQSPRGLDTSVYPKDLLYYANWFPTFLLVPGPVWDHAMGNLGSDSTAQMRDGVQVFNGELTAEGWRHLQHLRKSNKYNSSKNAEFVRFVKEGMSIAAFKDATTKKIASLPPKPIKKPEIVPAPIAQEVASSSQKSIKSVSDYCKTINLVPRKR
jgi:DNA-directed RNA polymerase subunit F